ncbi:MAG: glycoside hydrolase family 28 protein [Clostridia bacterium]|nr:glycoside hydrolase family 28 protein [Clostridia bacterium]
MISIRDYAVYSHEGTDWTEAFIRAIEDLKPRGGVLTVPAGEYPTGSIRLYDNMTLCVESGAVLRFHQDAKAFPLIELEFEGNAGLMHQACVYAEGAKNVVVTGGGTLDGQGDYWWQQIREKRRTEYPRPYLVCFADCEHVVLENVTLLNSPAWTVHPLRCRNVTVRGLNIKNPVDSPNTDGVNPDACQDVRILDCTIDVGDDCIAIKSGTENTPNRRPCERIIIANCHFLHGHGGVVLGSEMSGDVRNVVVSSCVFYETDRGIRLKTRRGRGGTVEGIQLSNLVMEKVMCPFVFNMYYSCGTDMSMRHVWEKTPYPVTEGTPCLRDVSISGVRARECTACAGFFYGLAEMPVEGVSMQDVVVEMAENGRPGRPAMMSGLNDMQGAGFFLRNAVGVDLRGVKVRGVKGDWLDIDGSVRLEQ